MIETAASGRARDHQDWMPDWITGYFHGTLRCSRRSCGEPVLVSGDYSVDWDFDEEVGEYPADFVRLRYALPALPIMVLPDNTPEAVSHRIAEAATVLWA